MQNLRNRKYSARTLFACKKQEINLVFYSLIRTFAPDLVMYLVFHHVHKRESGVNPEQYPLL